MIAPHLRVRDRVCPAAVLTMVQLFELLLLLILLLRMLLLLLLLLMLLLLLLRRLDSLLALALASRCWCWAAGAARFGSAALRRGSAGAPGCGRRRRRTAPGTSAWPS